MSFSLKNVCNTLVAFPLPLNFSLHNLFVMCERIIMTMVTHWKMEVLMWMPACGLSSGFSLTLEFSLFSTWSIPDWLAVKPSPIWLYLSIKQYVLWVPSVHTLVKPASSSPTPTSTNLQATLTIPPKTKVSPSKKKEETFKYFGPYTLHFLVSHQNWSLGIDYISS